MNDLDRIDFDILDALQKDARLSNKELAARVHLAPSSCLERVRRLRAAGALGAARTEVSDEALGIGVQAMIAVQLTQHSRDVVDAFLQYVDEVEEVVAVFHVSGEHDFLLHVVVADTDHLRDLLLDRFTTRNEVARVQTHILFSHRRKACRPNFRARSPRPTSRGGESTPGPR
jgi:DNA-binding Lrp family transcriptional regulator